MEILNLICSTMKLERDKGIAELQRNLNTTETDSIIVFINNLKSIYGQDALTWEKKLGALLATKILIPHVKKIDDTRFLYELVTVAQTYLTDNEVRVRLAAGEVLGALCEQLGVEVYKACHEYVFKLIEENLEREVIDAGSLSFEELKEIDNLRRKLESAGREKFTN
ncbi:HEATR2 [Cordylochernes scorpioides]|uniref:HEATR2 n=1 Tax=Cordylochernes scorpioides TaxID=51811 RepID=A0ABY6LCB9_9ARAC|nr:HEATR2 [Cordylochernes scorpioides]